MKKIIILCLTLFFLVLTVNITMVNRNNENLISLSNLVQTASAQTEDQNQCPGGSCTFTRYRMDGKTIDWTCTACCPVGKTPQCDVHGCQCW